MAERLQTVEKAFEVVALLAHRGALSLTEVSEHLGLSKPVVHRILSTLRELDWVEQAPETRKYRLRLRAWEIGSLALQHVPLYGIAMPMIERFALEHQTNAGLSIYDEGEMLFVARVQFSSGNPVLVRAGVRAPAHSTSSGKVALAFLDGEAERLLNGNLERLTPETVTDPEALRGELDEIRRSGYGINRDGRALGSSGVAAPIFDGSGGFAASVYSAVPSEEFTDEWVRRTAGLIVDCAANISLALGYRGAWNDWRAQG